MADSKVIKDYNETIEKWLKIESSLNDIRKDSGLTLVYLQEECNLNHNTVKQIESAGNYSMNSFFKFLLYTNAVLKVNNEEVTTIEELADVLSAKRSESGLKQQEVMDRTGLTAKTIVGIEKGRGYNRNSFLKYIKLYNLDFEIIA